MADSEKVLTKKGRIVVALDTNAFYNKQANYFSNRKTRDILKGDYGDLNIDWYAPTMVRLEREYQMKHAGTEAETKIKEIERLTGQKLKLDTSGWRDEITTRVSEQMKDIGLKEYRTDQSKVNLDMVMHDAAYRMPPFSPTIDDEERGFRDAMFLEAAKQLAKENMEAIEIIIVTDDNRLREACLNCLEKFENVTIFRNVGELQTRLTSYTLSLSVEKEQSLVLNAGMFFIRGYSDASRDLSEGLFFKSAIYRLRYEQKDQLAAVPPGVDVRGRQRYYLGKPILLGIKDGRASFSAPVTISFDGFRYQIDVPEDADILDVLVDLDQPDGEYEEIPIAVPVYFNRGGEPRLMKRRIKVSNQKSQLVKVSEGRELFEIDWTARVGENDRLSDGQVLKVRHIETTWEDGFPA